MDSDLKGKVALVTAASEGLGYACALRLAQSGCSVAICARREEMLAKAKKNIMKSTESDVLAHQADLTNADMMRDFVQKAYSRFKRIDILIGNTGHIPYGSIFDLEEDQCFSRRSGGACQDPLKGAGS